MARPQKHNWEKIISEYQAGASKPSLCESYGVSAGRLSNEFKRRGIVEPNSKMTEAAKSISQVFENVSQLSKVCSETQLQAVFDVGAAKGISAMKSERNKHALYDAIMSMIPAVEKASEIKDLALANKALDDSGKVDTAIQFNQTTEQQPKTIRILRAGTELVEHD
jgi:hypothetical protein